jgi:hypothetical protein
MPYRVQVIDIGCCSSAIEPKHVENAANQMASQGFELAHAYIDSTQACCGNKKSLILVFRARG